MPSFQWFTLSLRIIGVWTLVSGLEMLGSAYNVAHGHSGGGFDAWAYVNQAVLHAVIASFLIGLAPSLARLAYSQQKNTVDIEADRQD